MCSRYHVDDEAIAEIRRTVSVVEQNALDCSGDIHPSDAAPIIENSTSGY